MKNKFSIFIGLLTLFATLVACQPQVITETVVMDSRENLQAMYASESPAQAGNVEVGKVVQVEATRVVAEVAETDDGISQQPQERLIIRTGSINITVEDTEATLDQITSLAEALGGWVVTSNAYEYGSGTRGSIQFRFPAAEFNRVIEDIKSLAIEVENVSSSGQDVTEEFVDLEARLANLEATADRVRSFLADTDTVEEALAVNQELSRLEGEIEVIKGRMKYLSQSAAFSTINVEIFPDLIAQPPEFERWLPFEVAEEAIEALAATMQGLANFAIWLAIYILPVGLVIGIPLFFVGRWLRRKWQARRTVPVEPETESAPA